MVKLTIIESNAAIERKIKKALSKQVSDRLSKAANRVLNAVSPVIASALWSSQEIASLSSGTLRAEFGLTFDPSSQIVGAIMDSLEIDIRQVDSNLNGGFTLTMQPSNFSNLLSLPIAEQPIEKGGSIPWLEWLLKAGDSVVVADFGVEFGPHGRTGKARMARGKSSPYKVNSSFSGTADNNFITRAIDRAYPKIQEIIRRAL
jgi:hypothetical protein